MAVSTLHSLHMSHLSVNLKRAISGPSAHKNGKMYYCSITRSVGKKEVKGGDLGMH